MSEETSSSVPADPESHPLAVDMEVDVEDVDLSAADIPPVPAVPAVPVAPVENAEPKEKVVVKAPECHVGDYLQFFQQLLDKELNLLPLSQGEYVYLVYLHLIQGQAQYARYDAIRGLTAYPKSHTLRTVYELADLAFQNELTPLIKGLKAVVLDESFKIFTEELLNRTYYGRLKQLQRAYKTIVFRDFCASFDSDPSNAELHGLLSRCGWTIPADPSGLLETKDTPAFHESLETLINPAFGPVTKPEAKKSRPKDSLQDLVRLAGFLDRS